MRTLREMSHLAKADGVFSRYFRRGHVCRAAESKTVFPLGRVGRE